MKKNVEKVLSCLVVIAILMSAVQGVLADNPPDRSNKIPDDYISLSGTVSYDYAIASDSKLAESIASSITIRVKTVAHGDGTIKTLYLESEYLPVVVACENGAAPFESMKAQAVASRTFAMYKINHPRGSDFDVWDNESDQVYNPSKTVTGQHRQSVTDTNGIVLKYTGKIICAFYVSGTGSTAKYVTYNEGKSGDSITQTTLGWCTDPPSKNPYNRGCMGQVQANDLASAKGYDYQQILRYFYGADIEFMLDVPFKAQVPPGIWSKTKNCGQASALMVFCYYKGTTPAEQGIKDIDDWLHNKYGDPIDDYNGWYTKPKKLATLAREYGGFLGSYNATLWDLDRIKQEIDAGHPIIVAVYGKIGDRNYPEGHWLVVKGYNDTHIICNDPGTSKGDGKEYINSEFLAAMYAWPGEDPIWDGAVVIVMPSAVSLDLIFTIDTTGSMWDDIDNVKADASAIVDEVLSDIPNARIAVVDYRDFPVDPYGGAGDYPFNDVLSFSTDKPTIVAAIQGLTLGWGADWRESVYSALMHSIDSTSLGGWRGSDQAAKVIILMGDAPPHDPEPFTGYTLSSVVTAAENADPVIIYPVQIGGTVEKFEELADQTGGKAFTAENAGEVVDAILDALEEIKTKPIADANGPYTGFVGESITFDGTGSYDLDGTIVSYEWDLDDDGDFDDATGPTPLKTWYAPYSGNISLKVTDDDGATDIDTTTLTMEEAVDTIPPEVSAEFILIEVEEHEGLFEIDYSATDLCDPDPEIIAVILTPTTLADPELELKVEDEIKIEFDLEDDQLVIKEIKGPDPQALWQDIQEIGGLRVDLGQKVFIEIDGETEFKTEEGILKIEGLLPILKVTATDASDNIGEATAQPVFAPEEKED